MVLPTPPGPVIVTRRSRESRETSAATASSRPSIRVTATGRLCGAAGAIVGGDGGPERLPKASRGDEIVALSGTVTM